MTAAWEAQEREATAARQAFRATLAVGTPVTIGQRECAYIDDEWQWPGTFLRWDAVVTFVGCSGVVVNRADNGEQDVVAISDVYPRGGA